MDSQLVMLRVAEVFGPTIQGEGPHAGRRVGFLRLGLCNLSCSWCDTPHTWDSRRFDLAVEAPRVDVAQTAERLRALNVSTIVLTGGEPLIQQRLLPELMDLLPGCAWHVETNGTLAPSDELAGRVAHWSVSPKLSNSRSDPERRRIRPLALAAFVALPAAIFKFVATKPEDVDEAARFAAEHGIAAERVWIMPEGIDIDELVGTHRRIIAATLAAGFNSTSRLHVLLWGDERGV
jgi:7-carboxy-7-deazaguanine synthase